MLKCGGTGLLNKILLRKDLVEINFKCTFDLGLNEDVPEGSHSFQKTVVPPVFAINAHDFQ